MPLEGTNPNVSKKDFTDIYELSYKRLPGYEELGHKEYVNLMHDKLEKRRVELIKKHQEKNKSFLGREALREVVPGTLPFKDEEGRSPSFSAKSLSGGQAANPGLVFWYY